jgi:formylglycine-generating enzyme required for sulfatase activity
LSAVGWYSENSNGAVKEVGKKQANELGIYDMSGNLWELSGSWFRGYSDGSLWSTRGGMWSEYEFRCAVSFNDGYSPVDRRIDTVGFRVALSSIP